MPAPMQRQMKRPIATPHHTCICVLVFDFLKRKKERKKERKGIKKGKRDTCFISLLYVVVSPSEPRVCLRNESRTETMMLVSRHSRKQMKKTIHSC